MQIMKDNCHVITGGPAVGKNTLIEELGKQNIRIIAEDARYIIESGLAEVGEGLPWKNTARYAKLMLDAACENYLAAAEDNFVFFDRALVGSIC